MTPSVFKFRNLLITALISIFSLNITVLHAQSMAPSAPGQLSLPADDLTIRFTWKADTLNNKAEPYAALLIPVKLPGCPKTFYMQFDLGAHQSLLYTEKVNAIRTKYPKSIASQDSVQKLHNQQIIVAGKSIEAKVIGLKNMNTRPVNWNTKNSMEIIGTLGMDFIENKTIVLNYPGKKMVLANKVPDQLSSKLTLTKFMLIGNSILLPVEIQHKRVMLYFDTGSSAYELLTSRATCLALATPGTQPEQHQVTSWNRVLTANIYATRDSITIASQKLPLNRVTYMDGASNSQIEQMMKLGMGGMTGNKLFINTTLVIDTRNQLFGIIKKD